MASTYSTSLKIQEIGNGEQAGVWGNTTNTNWQLIEQAVAGVQTITMSNADYTLTNLNGVLDEARNMVLVIQGTNSAIRQVIAPLNQPKMYVIFNQTTGGYAITIGASSGSVVSIPNGTTAQVYTDGTNFFSAQTGSAGDFKVNGNFTVTGNQTDTGNLTVGGNFTANNAATFAVSPTAPTPTTGDNTTKLATTAFVQNSIGGPYGTMSTQNANAVAITGGTINGVTGTASGLTVGTATNATNVTGTVAIANGGTGLTSASTSGYALRSTGSAFSMQRLGLGMTGETWTSYTINSQRSSGTTYTNSNAYPIMVNAHGVTNGAGNAGIQGYVGGVLIASDVPFANSSGYGGFVSMIVPAGATYSVVWGGSSGDLTLWAELS